MIKRIKYDQFFSQFDDSKLTIFKCPSCKTYLKALKPDSDECYDSATNCPDCNCIFFKIVKKDGSVETELWVIKPSVKRIKHYLLSNDEIR